MTDLESILKTLGKGHSETGEKTTQEIKQNTELITQEYQRIPPLSLDERLALQRLAMESDRYLTSLVVNRDTMVYLARELVAAGNERDFWMSKIHLNATYHNIIQAGVFINIREKGKDVEYHARAASEFIKVSLKQAIGYLQDKSTGLFQFRWIMEQIGRLLEKYRTTPYGRIPKYNLDDDADFQRVYAIALRRARTSTPVH